MSGMSPAEKNRLYNVESKASRLEGQVQALIEAGRRNGKKLEKIEALLNKQKSNSRTRFVGLVGAPVLKTRL